MRSFLAVAVASFLCLFSCGREVIEVDAGTKLVNMMYVGSSFDVRPTFSYAMACEVGQLTWSIVENEQSSPKYGGDLVDGMYIAPSCDSPYVGSFVHVLAHGCEKTGTASIFIADRVIGIEIAAAVITSPNGDTCLAENPDNLTLSAGQKVQFYRKMKFMCRSFFTPEAPETWPKKC